MILQFKNHRFLTVQQPTRARLDIRTDQTALERRRPMHANDQLSAAIAGQQAEAEEEREMRGRGRQIDKNHVQIQKHLYINLEIFLST